MKAGQMCTPWILSKFLRCKPCFSRYECPPGEGSETIQSAVVTDASKRSIVDRKVSRRTGFGKEGFSANSISSEDGQPNKNKMYELHWHHGFEDEHYIVLCFGEEENIDWNDGNDELEVFDDFGNDTERLNADTQEEGEEESLVGRSQTEGLTEDNSDSGTGSIRSRNSDLSGGSSGHSRTGSFSFPVLHEEWIGSPVQMPRPEDLSRKNLGSHVCFQCCKF